MINNCQFGQRRHPSLLVGAEVPASLRTTTPRDRFARRSVLRETPDLIGLSLNILRAAGPPSTPSRNSTASPRALCSPSHASIAVRLDTYSHVLPRDRVRRH